MCFAALQHEKHIWMQVFEPFCVQELCYTQSFEEFPDPPDKGHVVRKGLVPIQSLNDPVCNVRVNGEGHVGRGDFFFHFGQFDEVEAVPQAWHFIFVFDESDPFGIAFSHFVLAAEGGAVEVGLKRKIIVGAQNDAGAIWFEPMLHGVQEMPPIGEVFEDVHEVDKIVGLIGREVFIARLVDRHAPCAQEIGEFRKA